MPRARTNYQEKDKNEHASLRPEMYVGPLEAQTRAIGTVSSRPYIQFLIDVKISPALIRILIELVCNASDNALDSKKEGYKPGHIYFRIEGDRITIENEGKPLPVEKMKRPNGEEDWIPSIMFSKMFASSHFDDSEERTSAGTFGVGAKMVNTLSSYFSVLVRDGQQLFTQTWENAISSPSKVSPCTDSPLVSITFTPDMARFPQSITLHEYHGIVRKIAADIALFSKVPVHFQSEEGEDTFDFGLNSTPAMTMRGANKVLFLNTPSHRCWILGGNKECVQETFVNGTPTYGHGKHVDALIKTLKYHLSQIKGLEAVDRPLIMSCTSFVLCSVVDRPHFNGACKDKLSTECEPIVWENLSELLQKQMPDLIDRLKRKINFSEMKSAKGEKPRAKAYFPCVKRGYGGEHERWLWISEGISASLTVLQTIFALYGSRDYHGVFAIRGKTLNLRGKSLSVILENEVVKNLIHVLGLRLDADYRDPKVRSSLAYDKIVTAADADVDGSHIRLLIVDLIHQLVPTLDISNFFMVFRSPIIKLQQGRQTHRFYDLQEWQAWQTKNPTGWSYKNVTYCKGLGSIGEKEAQEDALAGEDVVLKKVTVPDYSEDALSLAFEPKLTELRKSWILGQTSFDLTNDEDSLSIVDMVQKDLLAYSIATLPRSMPGFDGFNESQRLGVWASLEYGACKSDAILGKVLEHFNYTHGVQSLYGAIAGLAVDYPGSNNLPMFKNSCNFGSRSDLGANRAGSRYTEILPRNYLPYIFKKEDLPLLEYREVNGKKCEPKCLLPVIPLFLINGSLGIGTGWMNFTPCYKPSDIIKALETVARGGTLESDALVPWYRHYTGKVQLTTIRTERGADGSVVGDGFEWKIKKGEQVIRWTGKKVVDREKQTVRITEIPPYVATSALLDYYGDLGTVKDSSSPDAVDILLQGSMFCELTDKELGLVKTLSLTNMYILGENDTPRNFKTPEEAVVAFFDWRIKWYEKRKEHQVGELERKLVKEREFLKYLSDVLSKKFNPIPSDARCIETQAKYEEWVKGAGYTIEAVKRRKDTDTKESLALLKQEIERLEKEQAKTLSISAVEMMLGDLAQLKPEVEAHEKEKQQVKTNVVKNTRKRK